MISNFRRDSCPAERPFASKTMVFPNLKRCWPVFVVTVAIVLATPGNGLGQAQSTPLRLSADKSRLCAGEMANLTATGDNANNVEWSIDPDKGSLCPKSGKSTTYTAPGDSTDKVAPKGVVTVTATAVTVPATNSEKKTLEIHLTGPCPSPQGLEYRMIAGAEQSQSASSGRTWKFYGDLGVNAPISISKAPWVRYFMDVDFTSVPQQANFNVTQIASNAQTLVKSLKLNEMAQSINFLSGFELGSENKPAYGFALRGIVEGGFTTPLNPKEALQFYKNPGYITPPPPPVPDMAPPPPVPVNPLSSDAIKQLSLPKELSSSTQYIALTTPDRDRFYFQWYSGVRLKYFGADNGPYPAYVDITFGQNAAVTHACLCGGVWRMAGFWPLPKLQDLGLYVFGESIIQFSKGHTGPPVLLEQVVDANTLMTITAASPGVVVGAPINTRDYYHIGVAMDVVKLISVLHKAAHAGTQ